MTRFLKSLILALSLAMAAPATAGEGPARAAASTTDSNYVLVLINLPPQHLRLNGGYGDSYGDGVGRAKRHRIASRLAHDNGLTMVEDWPMPLVGVDCYVMAVPAGQSPDEVARKLSKAHDVAWAEPGRTFHAQGVVAPHATGASLSDPLFRAQPATLQWRLADVHQMATGRAVRVAVIDSMVETAHPDLAGQVEVAMNFLPGRSTAPEQHGTGVAGVIAARDGNHQGIVGVAPGARLMALRACWQQPGTPDRAGDTVCDSLGLAKAINYAVAHDAQVINLSLAGPPDPLLERLLDVALARGITVVGAYDRALPAGGFPADYPGVVAVTDGPDNVRAVMAPGRDIPTTRINGQWSFVNGSSYSAAHVSGLFALMRELSPRMRASGALVRAHPGGGIDVCATLLRVAEHCKCACAGQPGAANTAR